MSDGAITCVMEGVSSVCGDVIYLCTVIFSHCPSSHMPSQHCRVN